jgi:hypothetical protein
MPGDTRAGTTMFRRKQAWDRLTRLTSRLLVSAFESYLGDFAGLHRHDHELAFLA